ncbi:MAG: DUF11 domain-containing protein [Alphaproteobacteria bacterium]|nr:DUF11 domain-containing protein [Alphaproteobacteria bacterium]
MKKIALIFLLLAPFAAVAAGGGVSTHIMTFVEKTMPSDNGATKVVLEAPSQVFPGDKIVYVLSYHNGGAAPAGNFSITDPIPPSLTFEGTPDANALVSVDGGKSWGNLATLKITTAAGTRAARPEDVTHIRWALNTPIPAGGDGKLSFRGTVK